MSDRDQPEKLFILKIEDVKKEQDKLKIVKNDMHPIKKEKEKDVSKDVQEKIADPSHGNYRKDYVTMGLSNDESSIGGADTFMQNFPDSS
jgi:hypothetical protein